MRFKILYILLLFEVFAFLSFARGSNSEIQQLINQVKNAPPSEKYIYMNKLKLKLQEYSAEERQHLIRSIIQQLRKEEDEKYEGNIEHYEYEKKYEYEHEEKYDNEHEYNDRYYEDIEEREEHIFEKGIEQEEREQEFYEKSNFRYQEREEREYEYYKELDNDIREKEFENLEDKD